MVVSVVAFLSSLLVVVPAPTYLAWELSVGATEWGHYLALIALLALLPGWRKSTIGKISAVLAAAAIVLALSSLVRATVVARSLPDELKAAFGADAPRSSPDAPSRPKPIVLADMATGLESPPVVLDSSTYMVRDGHALKLDLYRPMRPKALALPVVIIIHGGAWRAGTRPELAPLNHYLAARGYAVVAPDYRLAPANPHPAASQDIHEVIAYLKSNAQRLGLDASRIVLIGRSAGGQLALLAAYTENDPAIRGAVGFYAPTDQLFGYRNPTNPRVLNTPEVLEGFLAGNPEAVPAAYESSSPLNFVGSSTVPTLLIHGEHDPLVWSRQSERLDARLAAARRPHFYLRLPWATHGCDYVFNGPCGQLSTYAIERFLAAVMK